MFKLEQVRVCDGACCVESPRFPNEDHSDCIYHIKGIGKESSGCQLMMDLTIVPDASKQLKGNLFAGWTSRKLLEETCVRWPQNIPEASQRETKTGKCCWQFIKV